MSFSAFAIQLTKRNPADYFYSAATHRSRGALWPIFAPARISLVQRAVETARRICREGGFGPDITNKTFHACMEDKRWAADYECYVKDNPYKHGNPRKRQINKEIGFRIREGIGGQVTKLSNGKPAKTAVVGSIIQTFTPMESFKSDAVR